MSETESRLAVVIDSTGAEKNAVNLTTALQGLTEWGQKAAASAGKVTKATEDEKEALSSLLDRIDPINAALNKLDKQQRELAKFKSKGLLDTDTFKAYSNKIDEARNRLAGFNSDLKKTGMSAKQTAWAMRMIPAQMTDIVVGLSTGQSPFMVLMQQGGQLKDMFGGIGPAIKGMASYVAGLINPATLAAGAVGVLGLAYYKGHQEQDRFNQSLTLTNNLVGKTASELVAMSSRVAAVANSTTGAASAVINELVSSSKVAGDELERVATAIVEITRETGISTDELVGNFNALSDKPLSTLVSLNDKYHFLTLATYNQVKALQDEGSQQEAARVATEAYASAMQQRAQDIHNNLGTLERAWNSLANAAGNAWDKMLDIGRGQSPSDALATLNENIADAQKRQAEGGIWNRFTANANGYNLPAMIKQRDELQAQITTQDVLTGAITKHNLAEQKLVQTQIEADRANELFLSNADRRNKAIKEQKRFLDAGAISAQQYANNVSRINEMYKDPKTAKTKTPKTPKAKAYKEDAGARLLESINQQTAALNAQLVSAEKLSSATQKRIKFEQQIAELKGKTRLTTDQKSLLAQSAEIIQAYKTQEASQAHVTTLTDFHKMQLTVRDQVQDTNDLLTTRLALLEKAKATGQLKPGEYDKTRADIYKNTPVTLPKTVTQVTGTLAPQGGELSGSYGGMQTQLNQVMQAQQQLQLWLQQQEAAYAQAALITTEGEARMTAIRQKAAEANQALETQKTTLINTATQSMMDSGLSILATGFGEQSAIYKAAFAASKAYAIAQSLVSIQQGIAMAAANPFPYNIAAMASVAAATASIVSDLSSVAGVGFKSGGFTGSGGVNDIAGVVHGKEYVFDAAATKSIGVSNLENIRKNGLDATLSREGYGTGATNVSGDTVSTKQNFNFTGSPIAINGNPSDTTIALVRQAQIEGAKQGYEMVAKHLANGQGKVSKALGNGWNTKRRIG
ncbi:phage tail length tape measure family protein [Pantoea vagans]|uniref:phage tail length tape measure family protein n=1 Tax=Pantoea vagans TaxID=470934 RepID=UPI00241CBE5D|nr:phage tail length tape measure family protein [Pantoea vagans]